MEEGGDQIVFRASGAPYELCVKTRKQEIITFDVQDNYTVAQVKETLKEKIGVAPRDQPPLYFKGLELENDQSTLGGLGIVQDGAPGWPIVEMGRAPNAAFHMHVELPDGKEHKACVAATMTCAQLKSIVSAQCGIPYLMAKLSFQGEELTVDKNSIGDYGIKPECKVICSTKKPLYKGPLA